MPGFCPLSGSPHPPIDADAQLSPSKLLGFTQADIVRSAFPDGIQVTRRSGLAPGWRIARILLTPNSWASPMIPGVLMVGLSGLLKPSRLLEVASSRLPPKCQTPANPSVVLNTRSPLLSLGILPFPQCIVIACWSLPMIFGILTQMSALPPTASHRSI